MINSIPPRGLKARRSSQATARKRLAPVGLLLLGSLLPSCKANEQWAFSVSREVYGNGGAEFSYDPGYCHDGSESDAFVFLAILLLPVAIDLVVLPVTLTHDLCDLD